MFSDFNSDTTGFESGPETERYVSEMGCQTHDLKTYEQETQTANVVSKASQAVMCHCPDDQSYDAEKLMKFLNRVLPHLEEELKSYNSDDLNFKRTDSELGNLMGEGQENVELSCRQMTLRPNFCRDKVVSSLSWNSSDVTLAVAYSEPVHKGWCCHETSVGLYNTEKPHFEKDPPRQLLKTNSCVRCLDFHSYIPSLLAGALYNGEVIVWDLRHEEISTLNRRGSADEAEAHADVITFLTWREDEHGSWLITGGRDGRIIEWKVSITNQTFEIYHRFLILKQHLITTAAPTELLEVLHMDFQSSKGPYFIAACDGGSIFYCSLAIGRSLTSCPRYKDPVLHCYKPRKGIITQVSCNPDMFASCGTDSEIHIFKYEQESPVLKVYTDYPLYGLKWNSPKELISWGDSKIECHKIKHSSAKSLICEVDGGLSALAFKISSVRQIRKFAIGNLRGDITILRDWIPA